jgi:hypothetical protein
MQLVFQSTPTNLMHNIIYINKSCICLKVGGYDPGLAFLSKTSRGFFRTLARVFNNFG